MSSSFITILLWAAALSSGLIAGVYFAFSTFIMRAFANIDTAEAIIAMNAINKTILRSLFMPLFFGSSIVAVLLMIAAFTYWSETSSTWTLIAGAIYFFGMFVCTATINVPLNNALARLEKNCADSAHVWAHYLATWTSWNHLRTVCSFITCVLCIWILTNR